MTFQAQNRLAISDGVSRLGLGRETSYLSLSLELFFETLHRLFFTKFCKEFLQKTVLKNDCSKFSCSKRSVAKLSLLLCCLRDGENNLPSTLFKVYTEFNKKCKRTNETAARNLCSDRLGSTLLRTIFELFFQEFVMKPIDLWKRGGRVPKRFFFEKPNETMFFFEVLFKALC